MGNLQLTPGNWVQIKGVGYRMVESVFSDKISYVNSAYSSEQHIADVSNISPIPPTKEILEKNGFYWGYSGKEEEFMRDGNRIRFGKHWVFDEGEGSISIILPSEDSGEIIIDDGRNNRNIFFSFKDRIYVHEIQQALRLAGLVEIANNFKV